MTEEPQTAEALMRSRFDAFKSGDSAWLLRTWHPSTRPEDLDLSDNPRWRGLQVLDTVEGRPDDTTGIVEFRASYIAAGELRILQERSRFVREDGRWYYVDGDVR
ncbi:YchJ family metal-binding protein [Aeromicrobium sp.]|uniref:YchJ family protein n=1 Tax=Aeromicrobium sp. TaxID=1871063 RepID=UPI0028AEB0E5|nr:YchJ family metal-binding protein [Aeromicrobium sp.]